MATKSTFFTATNITVGDPTFNDASQMGFNHDCIFTTADPIPKNADLTTATVMISFDTATSGTGGVLVGKQWDNSLDYIVLQNNTTQSLIGTYNTFFTDNNLMLLWTDRPTSSFGTYRCRLMGAFTLNNLNLLKELSTLSLYIGVTYDGMFTGASNFQIVIEYEVPDNINTIGYYNSSTSSWEHYIPIAYYNNSWVECDPYIYRDGAWVLCSSS